MEYYLVIVAGFVLSGVIAYVAGYSNGKKTISDKNLKEREDKWTAFVVVGIIFVVIGIAFSVSLNIWKDQVANGVRPYN